VLPNSLRGLLWHLSSAWERRSEPNVVLLHYNDLLADLNGEMSRLADRLKIAVPDTKWPGLVKAATFEEMRAVANKLQPLGGLVADSKVFFWKGVSGSGREVLTDDEFARYQDRMLRLASPEFVTWLHNGTEIR
jgi:aryl sulfotransferase